MSSLSDIIEEVRLAEASGKVHFHCGIGTGLASRPAAAQPPVYTRHNAKQVWAAAIEEALPKCRGNRRAAVNMVVRQQPQLREQLVSEANAPKPAAKATAKPVSRATAKVDAYHFRQQLARLVEGGMSRRDAAKQLSETMGLSQPRQTDTDSYWDQRKARYYS